MSNVNNDFSSGLLYVDEGLRGQTYQTTSDIHAARHRHARRLEFLDRGMDGPAGGRLLLMLPCNEILLNFEALKRVTSGNGTVYRLSNSAYIEWDMQNDWRDRRQCSLQTATTLEVNGGPMVTKSDWKWARDQLQSLHPECPQDALWKIFIEDAQAWWFERLTGPVFGHASGVAPFQLLDKYAFARRESGLPQISYDDRGIDVLDKRLAALDSTYGVSKKTNSFSSLVKRISHLANSKFAKDKGRLEIISYVDELIPIAQEEGRDQTLILLATVHAVEFGGISGILWAPVTIAGYTRLAEKYFLPAWFTSTDDERTGQFMYDLYQACTLEVLPSQRAKFMAYLEIFHRFLVIDGYEPLPKPLSGHGIAKPADATDVCPMAQDRACGFIDHFATSEQVRLQCNVLIRAGGKIPLRTYEPWCFRLNDIHEEAPVYLDIYPRRSDGQGKNTALRRQEGVEDLPLIRLLIDLKKLRLSANANDNDLLFGEPGAPGKRHEQDLCQRLVNASLRWATGNPRATFYDLRHTVFTLRAQPFLVGDNHGIENFDGFGFSDMSTSGGHAGAGSTYPYINRVEGPIAHFSQKNRPVAWAGTLDVLKSKDVFVDLLSSTIDYNPQTLDQCKFEAFEPTPVDAFGIAKRHEVLDKIADNLPLVSVAGGSQVSLAVVKKILLDFTQVAAQVGLVDYQCTRSEQGHLETTMAHGLWALHARQPKYKGISSRLSRLATCQDYAALNQLWQSWLACRHHEFLSLSRLRPALTLIKFLLECGLAKRNLLVVSEPGASRLDQEIASLGLPSRPEDVDRNGRAAHRLFFTAPGIDAEKASAATISTRGFSWWMLMVGSFLLANQQI